METAQFFVLRDGKYEGPLARAKLEEMVEKGEVKRSDLAFRDGLSNWMPVVAALSAGSAPPPPHTSECPPMVSDVDRGNAHSLASNSPPRVSAATSQLTNERHNQSGQPLTNGSMPGWYGKHINWGASETRWVLLLVISTLSLAAWVNADPRQQPRQLLSLGLHAAIVMTTCLWLTLSPARFAGNRLLLVGTSTLLIWLGCSMLLSKFQGLNGLQNSFRSTDAIERLPACLLLSVVLLGVVMQPFWWAVFGMRREPVRTLLLFGFCTGVVIGLRAPTVALLADWSPTLRKHIAEGALAASEPVTQLVGMLFSGLLFAVLGVLLARSATTRLHGPTLFRTLAFPSIALLTLYLMEPSSGFGFVAAVVVAVGFLGCLTLPEASQCAGSQSCSKTNE